MRVQVDVARRDDKSLRIQNSRPVGDPQATDFGDLAVFDADVGLIARHSRSINDHAPSNDGVELSYEGTSFGRIRAEKILDRLEFYGSVTNTRLGPQGQINA